MTLKLLAISSLLTLFSFQLEEVFKLEINQRLSNLKSYLKKDIKKDLAYPESSYKKKGFTLLHTGQNSQRVSYSF